MQDGDKPAVIVTGGSGQIGGPVVDQLRKNYRVIVLDRKPVPSTEAEPTVACDLTDRNSISEAFSTIKDEHGSHFAAVIHLAAYFDFTGQSHPLYDKLNVEGTKMLLEALQSFDVERFVYASTMLVHKPTEPGIPLTEQSELQPKWAYPESKAKAEQAIQANHGKIPYTLLRIAGLYTDQCNSPMLAHQIQRIFEHQLTGHVYSGETDRGQACIYIDDLIAVFEKAVDSRSTAPEDCIVLVGEPEVMSYEALQNAIADGLPEAWAQRSVRRGSGGDGSRDHKWLTFSAPAPLARLGAWFNLKAEPLIPDSIDKGEKPFIRPYMMELSEDHFEIDVSAAHKYLGWEPKHRLRDHIPAMMTFLREKPVEFYRVNKLATPVWLDALASRSDKPGYLLAAQRRRASALHKHYRWTHVLTLALGAWLLTAGATAGYSGTPIAWIEMGAGVLIMLLSAISFSIPQAFSRLATAGVGFCLAFAPLIFWTESPAAYLNSTLVAGLVMGFAICFPPEPGTGVNAQLGREDIPRGWTYSPSLMSQRLYIVGLALIGLIIARYMAAYQLGHTPAAWDPLFGDGTERIVTSDVSQAWPVPDSGLGAFVYLLEIITGLVGGKARWRTMPWIVISFGILIIPLGAISIYFIIIQPILIGTWCTLCLIAAAAMLVQIPLSLDEILATFQFLKQQRREGRPLLWVILRGGASTTTPADMQHAAPAQTGAAPGSSSQSGMSLQWHLLACAAIGLALMCSRLLAGTEPPLALSDHLLGALVITFSIASLSEVGRSLRFVNILLGCALIGSPFIFAGGALAGTIFTILCGVALIALSIPRGRIRQRYGQWTPYIV